MSFIADQIDCFVQKCEGLAAYGFQTRHLGDYIFHILPNQQSFIANSETGNAKDIPLTILALTHGVEVAGVGVLNQLLSLLERGVVQLSYPICLALGNPWAAKAGQRFLERDLNRCFSNPSPPKLKEEKRAAVLESVLKRSKWFFDIHQTKEFCPHPFFIFPYSKSGFEFARQAAPMVPIVTRKGGAFSKEGMCSDEYVNSLGGSGITIELGQNGFSPMAMGVGLAACMGVLSFVSDDLTQRKRTGVEAAWSDQLGPVYTWKAVMDYPESGEVSLRDDLVNFLELRKDEIIGSHDGRPIVAIESGPILFPQHYRDRSLPRPKELIRIMRTLNDQEITEL